MCELPRHDDSESDANEEERAGQHRDLAGNVHALGVQSGDTAVDVAISCHFALCVIFCLWSTDPEAKSPSAVVTATV